VASIQELLNTLAGQLEGTLLADRYGLRREIHRLRTAFRNGNDDTKLARRISLVSEKIRLSADIRRQRLEQAPAIRFQGDLPIYAWKDELIESIRANQVVIVAGETGSGKSTQLPKLCITAGRGIEGRIGVTQPRRIAATTVARRIADELGEDLGQTVGYQIRFKDTTAPRTRIKLMTDGILLAEVQKDPFLNQYDTLIVDEAHERSLNIDFILGVVKKLLNQRPDLKLIITSATLDTEKFAASFQGAPVIEVAGRLYDVETHYLSPDQDSDPDKGRESNGDSGHIEQAVQVVDDLTHRPSQGDILIFMPTEQDIRDTREALLGRRYPGVIVIPLFARLSAGEQQKVFQTTTKRKIVVATNVAETSITIPGIRYVVDTGLARISQYNPRSRTTTLPVAPISRSSADQRQGRCGRLANGVCFRLYSQEAYDQRPRFTPPEIVRSNLAEVILKMIALKLGDVAEFPFIDAPSPRSIQDGYNLLLELGAITSAPPVKKRGMGKYRLTPNGRLMSRLPLDPRLARILLAARERGCLDEAVVITAALSIQDPRERPLEMQAEADQAHGRFSDPLSDFIALLRIWQGFQQALNRRKGWNSVRRYCRSHFLSFRRMREWQDIYRQILQVLAEHKIRPARPAPTVAVSGDIAESWYAAVHQSILSGFLSNVAHRKEKHFYQAAHTRQAMIFPGSGLFKNGAQWIMAAEMVETSRLFARCAAAVDPAWIVDLARDQCRFTYLDPRWRRSRGQVVATEQVSLYGLILMRRMRPFGPVDARAATRIFIQQALIQGDVRQPLPFMVHNKQVLDEARDMENRLRRRDLLVDEAQLEAFYLERLDQVYDWRTLKHRIRKSGSDGFLRLTPEQVLNYTPDSRELSEFPDSLAVGAMDFPCDYRFEPGKESDGVTVRVPAEAAGHIAAETFQWLVPGMLREKITALIKNLPKEMRRRLMPVNSTVETIIARMPVQPRVALTTALSRFIDQHYGLRIPASAWSEGQLADHLRMRIAVTDSRGNTVRSGRDVDVLHPGGKPVYRQSQLKQLVEDWEQKDIRDWDIGDLPETIAINGRDRQWVLYPGLEVRDDQVVLSARADRAAMERLHRQGVKALLSMRFSSDIKFLKKNLKLSKAFEPHCRYFGGKAALEAKLLERVTSDTMAHNIRRAAEFDALARSIAETGLAAAGQATRQFVMDVLNAHLSVRELLFDLEKARAADPGALDLLSQLRQALQALVPDNFVLLYDNDRLKHVLRYIKAIGVRAQRAVHNLEKDQVKSRQAEPFTGRLAELVKELPSDSSDEKRRAIENYYWMVEEYKISLFAQEIGTAHRISAKRLKAQLDLIAEL
jgi:ATP-dependent helicase HrpA